MKNRLAGILAVLALTATLGLTGSSAGAAPAAAPVAGPPVTAAAITVPATWIVTLDWYCDGSATTTLVTFAADGSWTSTNGSFTHAGRWFQVGSSIVWTYTDVAYLIYSGQTNGNFMSGVYGYATAGGATGCFGASPSTTTAAAKTAAVDPVLPR
jgi:hypothetical protein